LLGNTDGGMPDHNQATGDNITLFVDDSPTPFTFVKTGSLQKGQLGNISIVPTDGTQITGDSDVKVQIDQLRDGADNVAKPGNISVKATGDSAKINPHIGGGPKGNFYAGRSKFSFTQGTQVALNFSGGNWGTTHAYYKINSSDGTTLRSGFTASNSTLATLDTSKLDATNHYYITTDTNDKNQIDGNDEVVAQIDVSSLGLNVDTNSQNITTDDNLWGNITANNGGRPVKVELLDNNGDSVDSGKVAYANNPHQLTLNGTADAFYNFGQVDKGTYTVKVTDVNSGVTTKTKDITVKKAGTGIADFGQQIYTQQRGDLVNITVNMKNTDQATVDLGSKENGYRANVTLTDDSGDGQVTLIWNTYYARTNAKSQSPVFDVANSDDKLNVKSVKTQVLGGPAGDVLEAGNYDINVRAGTDMTDDAQNVGTVTLQERSTDAVNVWTAPKQRNNDIDSKNAVYENINNGNITQTKSMALQDLVVFQIQATGLQGAFRENSFSNMVSGGQMNFDVVQQNPPANTQPVVWNMQDANNVSFYEDPANDTYFAVVNTNNIDSFTNSNGNYGYQAADNVSTNRVFPSDGDSWTANFTVLENGGNGLAKKQQSAVGNFSTNDAKTNFASNPLNVSASSGQKISGTTNVAPGSEIDVRVQSDSGVQPKFLKTTTVYVQPDHTWSAMMDFNDTSVGDTYSVTASGTVAPKESVDGTVKAAMSTETPMPTTSTPAPTETSTATPTATATPTSTPTSTPTATPTPSEGGRGGSTTQASTKKNTPGFGVIISVIALLAAALLAIRRD
ncbi:MAG: BGTF surface domain-containing protein, partial [Salinigranum sp.]